MAISQNFPSIAPSLSLNFASSRTLDPRITFTRTTSATCFGPNGLLKTVPANAPRFDHNPTTGESLGLLVEESRTNLLTYSEEFDDASWIRPTGTLTPNAIIAPDGTLTADYYYGNGTNIGFISKGFSFTSGVTYTYSVYAKKANTSSFTALFSGASFDATPSTNTTATFNFDTESITYDGGNITGSMTSVGNGWYRCTATVTAIATGSQAQQLVRLTGVNGDVYIWGAQLEAGSFPTSYIPTSGSTATRNPDNAKIEGENFSSWYNQSEGTAFTRYSPYIQIPSANNTIFCFESSSNNAIRLMQQTSTGRALYQVQTPDGLSVNIPRGVFTFTEKEFTDLSISYAQDNFTIGGFGGISKDTLGDLPIGITQLNIGNTALLPTTYSNCHISRVIYYPKLLTDTQLQTLTR